MATSAWWRVLPNTADENRSGQDDTERDTPKPKWIARRVDQFQAYRRQRRAEKYHENATDRSARSTARATWAVAILTFATIGVGISQYIIFSRQLGEMRATRESGDKSTADQMAIMRDQAKAMHGQLDQMQAAQRAWLLVDNVSVVDIQQFPAGSGITVFANYKLTNLGHTPATAIFIKTALILKYFDEFDTNVVRHMCLSQPADDEKRILSEYSDTILPGQSEVIDGLGDAASFSHEIESIDAERDAQNKVAQNIETKEGFPNTIPNKPAKGRGTFFISPTLVGCITYRIPSSGTTHETGFAFDARNGISTIPVEVGQKGEVYNGQPLQIVPASSGNFAN